MIYGLKVSSKYLSSISFVFVFLSNDGFVEKLSSLDFTSHVKTFSVIFVVFLKDTVDSLGAADRYEDDGWVITI